MTNIHRADRTVQRSAIVGLVIVGIAGAALIVGGTAMRPALEEWVREDVSTRLPILIVALAVIVSGPPLALAAYLWQFGGVVMREARFPPSHSRVVQDVAVIAGEAAVRRGRALRVFGAGLALSALLIAATLLRFILVIQ